MLYCLLLIVSRAYEGVTSYKLGQSERFKRGTFSAFYTETPAPAPTAQLLHSPLLEKRCFVLEALLPAQPPRVGDRDLATCANVNVVVTVTAVLSCTFCLSLNFFTESIDPVRFSMGSHVASLMG